jgi:hypothetical protein
VDGRHADNTASRPTASCRICSSSDSYSRPVVVVECSFFKQEFQDHFGVWRCIFGRLQYTEIASMNALLVGPTCGVHDSVSSCSDLSVLYCVCRVTRMQLYYLGTCQSRENNFKEYRNRSFAEISTRLDVRCSCTNAARTVHFESRELRVDSTVQYLWAIN